MGGILSAHLGFLHFAKEHAAAAQAQISGIIESLSHLFLLADRSEVVNHSLLIFIDFLLYFTSLLTSFFSYSSETSPFFSCLFCTVFMTVKSSLCYSWIPERWNEISGTVHSLFSSFCFYSACLAVTHLLLPLNTRFVELFSCSSQTEIVEGCI